jgi:DNA helicase-2/ATP-dependent DNA helicase PcrA
MEDVVRRSGMEAMLRKDKEADELGEGPLANVNELISSAAEFDKDNAEGSLDEYLANVSLVSDADHMKARRGGDADDAARGQGSGVSRRRDDRHGGRHPAARAARGNLSELEEERRLAFVGITRAQEHLILSKAQYRTIRGLRERTATSPFLGEMPQEMLAITDRTGLPGISERDQLRESFLDEADRLTQQFRRGTMVRHPQFGVGRIEGRVGDGTAHACGGGFLVEGPKDSDPSVCAARSRHDQGHRQPCLWRTEAPHQQAGMPAHHD